MNLFDVIFPRFCLKCGLKGPYLCNVCRKNLCFKSIQICPGCNKKNGGYVCTNCASGFFLDRLIVGRRYCQSEFLPKLIHYFKYRFCLEISEILVKFLYEGFRKFLKGYDNVVIVPVPLAKKRLLFRGYNQAEILAAGLYRLIQKNFEGSRFQFADCLLKDKRGPPQASLNKEHRRIQIRNSFRLKKDYENIVNNKKIILVDDVATTCSTLNECSKILKMNGAKTVTCLVLARS